MTSKQISQSSTQSVADKLENLFKPSRESLEDLLRDLPTPIAFVGNAPIKEKYGSLIDSHATVIRCNNFVLQGFQDYVGSKTTHWCINGKVDRVLMLPAWQQFFIRFVDRWRLHGIKPNPNIGDQVKCFTPKAFEVHMVEACRLYLKKDIYCLRDSSYVYPIHHFSRHATIGFMALYVLVQFVSEVHVFGFGGLKGGHYNNPNHKHNPSHFAIADRELQLIKSSDRVRFFE